LIARQRYFPSNKVKNLTQSVNYASQRTAVERDTCFNNIIQTAQTQVSIYLDEPTSSQKSSCIY